jgi:hypothetical protein
VDNTESRQEKAKTYYEEHLNNQQSWYSSRATKYRNRHIALSVIILITGALISILQLFSANPGIAEYLTAFAGGIIVVAKGLEKLWSNEETWILYRKSSEAMKREMRYYINGAGPYREQNEKEAYLRLVERVEHLLSEEQEGFWGIRDDQNGEDQ